ncbi:fungal-specific transcription factor domain-containing protein [Dactylonectria macrodidyma]|uniref:Fungal-specific transcription factor domain-containing protein n=1 Tax=Dactylonectria macrodidyma TaxID=307937 RepID=A0A9P9J4A6_9HYPO|nr:fungal-specific transcription factor domain-containing protein [Dactylonectria macrodidyma]
MAPANAHSAVMPDDEANSAFSQDEASSGEDGGQADSATAPRKRRRETHQKTSCELCKARKVKCDRAEPACSWCARHNRTCIYPERQKVGGSRVGFNLDLEAKVNRIDALLQALGRRVEVHIAHDHEVAVQQMSPSISTHSPSQMDSYHQNEGQMNQGVLMRTSQAPQVRTPGYSSPSWRMDNGQERLPSRDQVSSARTQMNLLTNGPSISNGSPSLTNGSSSLTNTNPDRLGAHNSPSLRSPDPDLPPHYMLFTLVDLYFKHCNTWCPILDRKTTFETFFGPSPLKEPDQILLYAIVATTLRFSKDARLTPETKAHYHRVSRHRVQIYAMEHISIPALRALVIVCLDELGTSNGPRGWNLLSLLVQNVRQLDLCKEASVYLKADSQETPHTGSLRRVAAGEPESWIEDEGRRRLCWVVYLLDRYATVATTTFDFMLEDTKMKRILPCSYDLFSRNTPVETQSAGSFTGQQDPTTYMTTMPENLGSFSYHCAILRILSKVHDFLKTPIDITSSADMANWRNTYRSLDDGLNAWLQNLPSEYGKISALCHSDPASRVANWFMLHSAYVTSVVRLHSSAAYPAVRSHILVPSHYAMQKCLSAVQSLGDIAQDVLEANALDLLGPPFAFSLWVAARLLLVHAATVGSLVDSKITFFIDTLRHVGQHWEVANNYAKILDRVVNRERQGVMSFAVMRRSAYDLVTLTSATRQSGIQQTSTQVTSLSELDNIDVFDFFNCPKVLESVSIASGGHINILPTRPTTELSSDMRPNTVAPVPTLESDWLGFSGPFS